MVKEKQEAKDGICGSRAVIRTLKDDVELHAHGVTSSNVVLARMYIDEYTSSL